MITSRKFRKYVLVIVGVCCICQIIGVFDYFFVTPFSMFRWPPFIDVNKQVELRLRGEPSTVPFENSWASALQIRLQPQRKLCGHSDQPFVLIAVRSAIGHFDRRETIRQLWGKEIWGKEIRSKTSLLVASVFVLGRSTDSETNIMANQESSVNRDILMGDYSDAYTNITFKLISALQYFVERCGENVHYLLLVDDDHHVSIRNLMSMLLNSSISTKDLYMGFRFETRPIRFRFSKFYIPLSLYPFSTYPPYITGGAVLLSRATARKLLYASYFVRFFPLEDVYAGIIAYLLHIELTHDERFPYWPKWSYNRNDYVNVITAHGFHDMQLMKQAFFDSDGGIF